VAFGLPPLAHAKKLRQLIAGAARQADLAKRQAEAGDCFAAIESYADAWRFFGMADAHRDSIGAPAGRQMRMIVARLSTAPRKRIAARHAIEAHCLRRR
jgi:hypothetical protein